jgi:hypothetical protein
MPDSVYDTTEIDGLLDLLREQASADFIDDGELDVALAAEREQVRLDIAAAVAGMQQPAPTPSYVGGHPLDSFDGDTADDQLTAAESYVAAQTFKPAVILDHARYVFNRGNRPLRSGFKLLQPLGFGNQARAASSSPTILKLNFDGPFYRAAESKVFDVEMAGFGVEGNATNKRTDFMATGGNVVWTSKFHDLGFTSMRHEWGTENTSGVLEKFLNTACLWDGWYNSNNSYGVAGVFGGSDSDFWMSGGALFDSPPAYKSLSLPHLMFSGQQKANVGPIFLTAEGRPGVVVDNSPYDGPITFHGSRLEGRNEGQESSGPLLRVRRGNVKMIAPWLAHSKAPMIQQDAGLLTLIAPTFKLGGSRFMTVLNQVGGKATVVAPTATPYSVSGVETVWSPKYAGASVSVVGAM